MNTHSVRLELVRLPSNNLTMLKIHLLEHTERISQVKLLR
jgi:hypothetical protein